MHHIFTGFRSKDLNDSIILILAEHESLTARKIYSAVRRMFSLSVTYQAVHKTLGQMAASGIIEKKGFDYSLSRTWLDDMTGLIENIQEKREERKRAITGQLVQEKPAISGSKRIKVLSFDMDGCLTDNAVDEFIWRREIPRIYSQTYRKSFDEAFERVTREYRKLWGKVDGWRDPVFWIRHLKLNSTFDELWDNVRHLVSYYGDAVPVLAELSKEYTLIVISHADRKLLEPKLGINNLRKFFFRTFSTTSDFGMMKKAPEVYKKVCRSLGIAPSQIVHVGDEYEFDYQAPLSVGIKSFLIDRTGNRKEDYVVRDLFEFRAKIGRMGE